MDADKLIRQYEARKKEIEEMQQEQEKLVEKSKRLEDIDAELNAKLKRMKKINKDYGRLAKKILKLHQPDRRTRCEYLLGEKDQEMRKIKRDIEDLKHERIQILQMIQVTKIP